MSNEPKPSAAEGKLWGGRFRAEVDPQIHRFTRAIEFDHRLVRHDLVGSLAHARMLWECGLLDEPAAGEILGGLAALLDEIEGGRLEVTGPDEDIHSWIERQLFARIGESAGRLHTARSRNDQTSLALRLYTRERLADLAARAVALAERFAARAEPERETWLPGYTHQQRGQPVSLAHHLLAHAWALLADAERLLAARDVAGVSPLGAGALAGTPQPIDPARSAALLGLPHLFPNSLLAVADRDYVAEAIFACALAMTHLSRWAAEVVSWSSAEVRFVRLADSVAKGSSLMPQKKNPEPAELMRGKCGRVLGDLQALLVVLKGIPFAYNSDLQEDKEALFDALDTTEGCLAVSLPLLDGLEFDRPRMAAALAGGFLTATALADLLVAAGVPFRRAHAQAGAAVLAAEERGCELWELALDRLRAACPDLPADAVPRLRPEEAGRALRSPGGTAPERVAEQLGRAHATCAGLQARLAAVGEAPIRTAAREGRLLAADLA